MAKKGIPIRRSAYSIFWTLLLSSCHLQLCSCAATDTISLGKPLTISDTIVSASEFFELGFFRPSHESQNYYVGIWYSKKRVSEQTVVWVANRQVPITNSSAVLAIADDGSLVIMDGRITLTVANMSTNRNRSTSATLLDSGNLVLSDEKSNLLWQSFDFPTDTLLPGMKIGYDILGGKNWSLVSWKSTADPALGDFSFMLDPNGTIQLFLEKESQIYWSSGPWNGQIFTSVPEMRVNYIYNFSCVSNEKMRYLTYSLYANSIITRIVMDISGRIQLMSWTDLSQYWSVFWSQPRVIHCEKIYGYCGAFASCVVSTESFCRCLWGFEPRNRKNWENELHYDGCGRKSSLQCNNSSAPGDSQDRFFATRMVRPASPLINKVVRTRKECESSCLKNCNCTAFAYFDSKCSTWEGDLINLQETNDSDPSARDLHIRLAASEFSNGSTRMRKIWIAVVSAVSFTITTLCVIIYWMKMKRCHGKGVDLLSFDFSNNPGDSNHEAKEGTTTEENRKEVEIPLFSFSSVSAATNDFSSENLLGEGGFGPVYKGKLLSGYEVAVKRLSKSSGQGWEELNNEAKLIAKLQHRNLVKLLGCCIEGEEKILVYEYLPNKSLDFFLFGPSKNGMLDWSSRVRIIEGIAQGLLYLHQFSRVQIIHRDLKASNILLDKDMNTKISDFGMARIFGGRGSQATKRIVGTYGYMSPEYALQGVFSVKSDVFSFGVLLLEILSGKKNTGFYQTDSLNLLGYAWDLWRDQMALELIDSTLGNIPPANASLRYINIGLLCVQEHASDRPTMSDVISMLSNEGAILTSPKQPAFSASRGISDPSNGAQQVYSVNEMTVSILSAR